MIAMKIRAFSGAEFDVEAPDPARFSMHDIARGLAHQCRFAGQFPCFYSVAEHSLYVADVVRAAGGTPLDVFWGLMHDAAEAYLGDIITPVKCRLPEYERIEHIWQAAIASAYGVRLDAVNLGLVHEADLAVRDYEMAYRDASMSLRDVARPAGMREFSRFPPSMARERWLEAAHDARHFARGELAT